jgi:hypothetical protein
MLDIVEKVQKGINSSKTYKLKSNDHLDNGDDANAETKEFWTTTTFQDKKVRARFWDQPRNKQPCIFFHEMTHLFGTDDNTDYFPNEATKYEDLISDDPKDVDSVFYQLKNIESDKCKQAQKKKTKSK